MRERIILFPKLTGTMASHGDTCESLGAVLNLSPSSISSRMTGKVEWSIGEIKTICEYYGKSFYELFD